MTMCKCLYCYGELAKGQHDYHPSCAKKFFGKSIAPELPYTRSNLNELGRQVIQSRVAVPGVQEKLSLDINKGGKDNPDRLTIVGLWGRYILKPKSDKYPWLPEDEDLTIHLAEVAHIKTVPHTLIRFQDGELAYITQRVDRDKKGNKYPMEDACQLSGRLAEDKYKSSYEHTAKVIRQYSSTPLLDLANFWELVVFSFITGNSDMHMKNFSLYSTKDDSYTLSPAYDLLNVHLILPDPEELALTLDGKKRKLTRSNFENAMQSTGLDTKVISNLLGKFSRFENQWRNLIDNSFLPEEMKETYKWQIHNNLAKFIN